MATKREPRLVRFVSPFGSPAWMSPSRARELLEEHDKQWCWMQDVESQTGEKVLSNNQRAVGPPRIERGP